MGETRSPRVFALVVGGLVLLSAVTGGVLYALVQREDARWPSLADTSRVSAPTAPVVGDGRAWDRIAEASAGFPSDAPDFQRILDAESTPSADGLATWQPFAARIDALRAVMTETTGLSIPQPVRFDDPGVSLLPLLKLCRAWLLSGWAHAAAGAPAHGVTEMLHVQALATRLMLGDTGLVDVMVGIAIDQVARRELRELLATFGAATPSLYAHAAAGLAPLEPGSLPRALAVEARSVEAVFAMHGESMSWVEAWGYDEELTRVWYRTQMQRLVDHAATPRWERTTLDPLPLWSADGGLVQQLHNRTGRILLDLATADYDAMIAREDAAVAGSRLDVLLIAARRYAFDHAGALPAGQTDLVPDYLPAPLLDPYDGEPLRLDRESLWSVGESEAPEGTALRLSL
jgi:hypothetical protein